MDCMGLAQEIDQPLSRVLETVQNPNRANFPLISKAKNFDGPSLGFGPSEGGFFALGSMGYNGPKQ
jgi:hypothetical protein